MASDDKGGLKRDFSRVILTLENQIIPEEKLSPTPSMSDGLDSEIEMDLRILGCELIQTSGILLKLPQVAMATGQVLFQRFYCSKSFVKHPMEVIAMACINLASKIEEAPRRIRDVINVFHHIKQVRSGKTITPLILNQDYVNLKNQVIKGERRILKELGFCVHVKHPHKIIVMYLQVLEKESNQRLVQSAWNYMNDSFRTDVFVRFHPETIACACIYMASRQLQIPLPNNPPWYALFRAESADMDNIAVAILRLYKRKKPNADKLEAAVNECKKIHIEAKKKARGLGFGDATPNSRAASPHVDSPNTAVKKLKAEVDRHSGSSDAGFNHRGGRSRSRSRTPRSITNSRSFHSSSRSRSRSRSRSPRYRSRHRSPKKYKSKHADKYGERREHRYDTADRYKADKYSKDLDYDSKYHKKHKRRSASYSPSPRRSYTPSPERRHKKKDRYRSPYSKPSKKSKKHSSNGHRSRSRERHRR